MQRRAAEESLTDHGKDNSNGRAHVGDAIRHKPGILGFLRQIGFMGATAQSMTAFDDRKTAAEAKFAHDQEFQFKTIARRNKLLGLWAAEQMGISGADAEAYAKQVVIADFEEPGDADVLRKVLGDLTDKGIATDEHKVRHEMTRLLEEAKTQVLTE